MQSAGSAQTDLGEFAPAKVNLCLHVTGRRDDGYHLLDSLVVFAGVGDRVSAQPDRGLSLRLTGPEAMALGSDADNLVLRAARLMAVDDVALTLDKQLPVASGIGGGSADAAATLRLLARWTKRPLPDPGAVLRLGADVPVCLAGQPVRMRGVGEDLSPLPPLPPVKSAPPTGAAQPMRERRRTKGSSRAWFMSGTCPQTRHAVQPDQIASPIISIRHDSHFSIFRRFVLRPSHTRRSGEVSTSSRTQRHSLQR